MKNVTFVAGIVILSMSFVLRGMEETQSFKDLYEKSSEAVEKIQDVTILNSYGNWESHILCVDLSTRNLRDLKGISTLHVIDQSPYADKSPFPLAQARSLGIKCDHNHLTSIPQELKTFTRLRLLQLSYNKLREIPAELSTLDNLNYLELAHNELKQLPDSLQTLTQLRELNLSANKFKRVPHVISSFVILEVLELSHNTISELPLYVSTLEKLAVLNLSSNNFTTLPEALKHLIRLRVLDMSDNHLQQLQDIKSDSLVALNLSNNYLEELPPTISNLQSLQCLYLYNNKLKNMPKELNLPGLIHLTLSCNRITKLPISLLCNKINRRNLYKMLYVFDIRDNNLDQLKTEQPTLVKTILYQLAKSEDLQFFYGDFTGYLTLLPLDLHRLLWEFILYAEYSVRKSKNAQSK